MPVAPEDIDALLSEPGSPLFAGGRSYRPVQVNFAREICASLCGPDRVAMIEADTGVGKTLGYLVPALLWAEKTGGRVIVSTYTLDLQKQVMSTLIEARDAVAAHTGTSLRVARRVGRRNFVDPGRVAALIEKTPASARATHAALAEIEAWLEEAELDEMGLPVLQSLSEHLSDLGIHVPFDLKILSPGPGEGPAAYERMVDTAREADILVVNHALLVIDLMTYGRVLGIHPPRDGDQGRRPVSVIVDEADQIRGVTQAMTSARMPFFEIATALRNCLPEGDGKTEALERVAGMERKAAGLLDSDDIPRRETPRTGTAIDINAVMGMMSVRRETGIRPVLRSMSDDLDRLSALLKAHVPNGGDEEWRLALEMESAARRLIDVTASEKPISGQILLYATPVLRRAGLMVENTPPEKILSRLHIFAPDDLRTVMVSATLTMMDGTQSMSDFGREIGLMGSRMAQVRCQSFSPEGFARVRFRAPPPGSIPPTSLETDEDDIPPLNPDHARLSLEVIAASAAVGKRTLVLVPSYRDSVLLQRLAGDHQVLSRMVERLFFERPATRAAQREGFRETAGGILVSAGGWSGMDMPGTIDTIVVPRIPVPPPASLGNFFREAYLQAKGVPEKEIRRGRFFQGNYMAMRKIRQGIGRGTRAETDDVTVWILDPKWPFPGRSVEACGRTMHGMRRAIPERFRSAHDAMTFSDPWDAMPETGPAGDFETGARLRSGRAPRRRSSF